MIAKVLDMLDKVKGAQFARFTYRAKGTGELARHTLILGVDFKHAYEKDLATLETLIPTLPLDQPLILQAAHEIRDSLQESLNLGLGNNLDYVHGPNAANTYAHIDGLNGVIVHRETGELYVFGYHQDKTVLEAGEYKKVNHRPLTIAKRQIDRNLRRANIRQFSLGELTGCAIAGETVDFSHSRGV